MSITLSGIAAARRSRRAATRWAALEARADGDGLVESRVGPMLRVLEAAGGWYADQCRAARDAQARGRGRRVRGGR